MPGAFVLCHGSLWAQYPTVARGLSMVRRAQPSQHHLVVGQTKFRFVQLLTLAAELLVSARARSQLVKLDRRESDSGETSLTVG